MMKKVLSTIVTLAVGAYFVNSYLDDKAKTEAERAESKRIAEAIKLAISRLVADTGAVANWESNLTKGENFRFDPVLTVELEQVWLKSPILFVGSIKDIATFDDSHYIVLVERSMFSVLDYMFSTELQLSLIARKDKIDFFLGKHPNLFGEGGFYNGVAVVANVKSIRTVYFPAEDEPEEVKIGEGELVDILFTGDALF